MILLDALSIALAAFALYLVNELGTRVKALEARKPEPEKRKPEIFGKTEQVPDYLKPIENFTPKKPETLRPNQVRGRDIQGVENVIEFDVKIKP